MSAEPAWTLADYIRALVAGVAAAEPLAAARLRQTVGARSAVIAVGAEAVLVRFRGDTLEAEPVADGEEPAADGHGATDRATVLDLLAGRIEVTEAVLADRLHLSGSTDSIMRIGQAIEILLDVSVRAPALQRLADRYRRESDELPASRPPPERRAYGPGPQELEMLGRLGLLPGE